MAVILADAILAAMATPTPADAVRAEIARDGPITFARYMELALYGEGGYYASPPVGPQGDFVTSPHVHPVFGRLIATALLAMADGLGRPGPWDLVESGAGDGTLAAQLLEALGERVRLTTVEVSPGARGTLARLPVRVAAQVPETFDLFVANELLDNLPFRLVRGDREVRVEVAPDGHLTEVETEPDDDIQPWLGRDDGVAPVAAEAYVAEVSSLLAARPGYALFIDYGGDGSTGGPAHGYAGHDLVEDLLAHPGATDITAGLDMTAMAAAAVRAGAHAFPIVSQRAALAALGYEDWARAELAAQHDHLDRRDGLAAVRAWSARGRASMLVDPGGLGRFRWLVLATPGLPAPAWLERASAEGLG
jgi:SAM-dependent MidA family methyltransferase